MYSGPTVNFDLEDSSRHSGHIHNNEQALAILNNELDEETELMARTLQYLCITSL
jgi:hypothetical protein